MISNTFTWNGILNALLIIVSGVSIWYATRNTIKRSVTDLQRDVIAAQEVQIQNLKDRIDEMERKNTILLSNQETVIAALSHRGIYVTIDGDIVTFMEKGKSTVARRRSPPPAKKAVPEKKEPLPKDGEA